MADTSGPNLPPDRRLWRLWRDGGRPDVRRFLAECGPLPVGEVVAVLAVDQQERWLTGERVPAEDYLRDFPEAAADAERALELVYGEFLLREELGESPDPGEFLRRFPHFAERLSRQFRLHEAFAEPVRPPDSQTRHRLDDRDSPEPPAAWPRVSGYDILGVLGRGGMGVVYKAWQHSLRRVVALKMLLADPLDDPDRSSRFLARFRSEAEAEARLKHPNIVQIHDVGEVDGQPYLCLEYVEGESLDRHLRGTPQPPRKAAETAETLARAVHHAHERGVIHRDLKPGNVLVGGDGTLKVADFGLAKILGGPDNRTRTDEIVGTLSYMAPEQAMKGPRDVGPATDVYALGAILYECLTGRPPFLGATVSDLLVQLLHSEAVPVRALQPGVPRDLETVCLKCLEKEPRRRYASALELADDLRRFLGGVPTRARPVGPLGRFAMWCRRKPALAVAGGAVAAALLAIVVLSVAFGIEQRKSAETLQAYLTKAQHDTAVAKWDLGRQLCEEGEIGHGMLVIADALKNAPEGPAGDDLRRALRTELAAWHLHTPTLAQIWQHPDRPQVHALAVSPDGETVATGASDGKVRLWELESGNLRREIDAHRGGVWAVAFGCRGNVFITGGADGKARLWDAADGRLVGTLEGHEGSVRAAALSPDGRRALTGGEDKTARLWDLTTAAASATLEHDGQVMAVAFSPDGQWLLTAGGDKPGEGEVRLYEAGRPATAAYSLLGTGPRKKFAKRVRSAAFSPDGRTLLIGDDDWEATLWDVDTLRQMASIDRNKGDVLGVAFSPDGKTAVTAAFHSRMVLLWDVEALRDRWEEQERRVVKSPAPLNPPVPHSAPATAAASAPDGRTFLVAGEDGDVRVWRKAPGYSFAVLPHSPKEPGRFFPNFEYVIRGVAIDPGGRLAALAGTDGRVTFWRVPDGEPDGEPLVHPRRVNTLAFLPGGQTVVTACEDGHVRFWDVKTRTVVGEPLVHDGVMAQGLSISGDGTRLLVGCSDGTAHLWDVRGGTRLVILRHGTADGVGVTAISRDCDRLLTGSDKGSARLWSGDGVLVAELPHQNGVMSVMFSADGKTAVTSSSDQRVRFWDADTGKAREPTLTLKSSVDAAVLFADGKRLLTGSEEGAQLWDVALRRRVGPPLLYEDMVFDAALSPDETTALLADWDGYGLLWHLPAPVPGDPERVRLWVETEVGLELDQGDGRQALDGPTWQQRRKQLRVPGGTP